MYQSNNVLQQSCATWRNCVIRYNFTQSDVCNKAPLRVFTFLIIKVHSHTSLTFIQFLPEGSSKFLQCYIQTPPYSTAVHNTIILNAVYQILTCIATPVHHVTKCTQPNYKCNIILLLLLVLTPTSFSPTYTLLQFP